ncbi:MAG: IclR family transcriptional regulator [Oscillospiraceae bacterium]|nr:IclR family transcriptional regulator [Oscillospiraceae bacterium]
MIQSVDRAVQILRCFDGQELLGITELATTTNLNKSTAFGLVTTLTELGLLEQDTATGRYRLGLELFRLGSLVNADTRRLVMPSLEALTAELEETVNFVRPDGGDVVYLVKKESPHSMRICTRTGQRLPMYCSAVGKVILAGLPAEEREEILRGFDYHAYTEFTRTTAETLRQDLADALRDGYALDREELEYGLICIAVPIRNRSGRPIAAISCSGPKVRMTEEKIARCRRMLQQEAEHLAVYLG